MSKLLGMFKTNLEVFASKHNQEIWKNPEFCVQFQDTCATIGELSVHIIKVRLVLKHWNGGLITLEELHQQALKGKRNFTQNISQDLMEAIKKLKALGTGFDIIPMGGTYLIQSFLVEFNMDHTVGLQLAEKNCCVTVSEIKAILKWETE
ncbi:ESCRT-II subunit protein snf8 [Saguinus oedipus]|uniref:Vacuolar-sorting protein SNF8 n=1 Tax=Saguinus oedipus TaxID=9490 RepID=A0ABQ9VG29_SAGOE|nr:ESCRT-II subunit protein snf8 [Saguinus oedipus]